MRKKAVLVVEDEDVFVGEAMGHEGVAAGTVACCGLAAGFPDLLTDPAYGGKMVCFTYPHVGNAGVVPDDLQSGAVAARAVIAREISKIKANRLGVETMDQFLKKHRIPAIEGVDTRTITEIVTRRGMVRAVLGCGEYADADALAREFAAAGHWQPVRAGTDQPYDIEAANASGRPLRVVVYDLGVKKGFLRRLAGTGCQVKVVPADYAAEKTLAEKPDGVVFSAGPGAPEARPEALPQLAALIGKVPVWGVGLGAGLLALAVGATVVTNGRFRAGVHPIGRPGGPSGEMTAQCRDFWVEGESLAGANLVQTHFHLNDGALEGFKCDARRLMGVLFHPEGEPGPHDSLYLFDRFYALMRK